MSKKAKIKITLNAEFDLNKEATYQLITRLQGSLHAHIYAGMLSSGHMEDADLIDVKVNIEEE